MDEFQIPPGRVVYRCEYCHKPIIETDIQQGGCACGSRRIRVATSVTADELEEIKGRGYEFNADYWMDEETAKRERRVERAIPKSTS